MMFPFICEGEVVKNDLSLGSVRENSRLEGVVIKGSSDKVAELQSAVTARVLVYRALNASLGGLKVVRVLLYPEEDPGVVEINSNHGLIDHLPVQTVPGVFLPPTVGRPSQFYAVVKEVDWRTAQLVRLISWTVRYKVAELGVLKTARTILAVVSTLASSAGGGVGQEGLGRLSATVLYVGERNIVKSEIVRLSGVPPGHQLEGESLAGQCGHRAHQPLVPGHGGQLS